VIHNKLGEQMRFVYVNPFAFRSTTATLFA
jgi:hypothetical protein